MVVFSLYSPTNGLTQFILSIWGRRVVIDSSTLCLVFYFNHILLLLIFRSDMKSIVLILANANAEVTNANVSPRDVRTPLLLACAIGNLAIAQLLIWVSRNKSKIITITDKYVSLSSIEWC